MVSGGFDLTLFSHRFRTHEPLRPLELAALALALFVPLYGAARVYDWGRKITRRIDDALVAVGLALFILAIGIAYSTTAASGPDPYGYVSQADLWLKGNLHVAQPWTSEVPWPDKGWTFSPLGYRPPDDEHQQELVPTYAPGLPLLMAGATSVAGRGAAFCIVPLAGAVLVLMTYAIGRRLGSPRAGLIGAWLVATSPVVLSMLMVPMTDVPVAAAWSVAFFLMMGPSIGSAAGAGLAAGLAILIRPNLAPLAGVLAIWYLIRREPQDGWRANWRNHVGPLFLYSGGAALGVAVTALINARLYGSPFISGYGDLGAVFSWRNVMPNVRLYLGWLVDVQTPLALAGIAAILVPLRRFWPGVRDRRIFLIIGALLLVLWAEYCFYIQFDTWRYLRFLLPSWPFVMIAMGGVALAIARGASPGRVLAVAGLVIGLGVFEYRLAGMRGAFDQWRSERASILIARRVSDLTEPGSVVLSMFHSGSVRYYGGRMTMRFDILGPAWLDRSVDWLMKRGVHPYLLVNDWEVPMFLERFGAQRTAALLNVPPVFTYQGQAKTFLFDLVSGRPPSATTTMVTDTNENLRSAPPVPLPRFLAQ